MTTPKELYQTDEEVSEVVRRFESCGYAPDEFKHRLHLAVALVYLLDSPYPVALERMRSGLKRFVEHHGLSGVYHETLTVFWMRRVRAFAERADRARGLARLANELSRECADPRVVFDYYSRARVESDEARACRLDPDLKPLDF
jgi:hypothetical protein